ncbi:MAG TPA: response regulator [Candidatus Paceibacterota bacterium]
MGQKILVAEDDAILREILMSKLTSAGYVALVAEDGAKALEIIKSDKPALILLDILIPIKNGLEVLEEMNQDPVLKLIPVIALSNSDDAEQIKKARALGARDFLIKAIFDSSDVLEKVAQVLRAGTSAIPAIPPTVVAPTPTSAPLTTPTAVAAAIATGSAEVPGARKSILIIEDDRFLREIAGQKLEAEGFAVMSATNGKEALEILATKARPNIIVLDLILPGMSGYEILEKVKQDVNLKDIPVLILSNLGQEEDIDKAKKLGATDYLVKAHFSFAEIIKKIREIVG